MTTTTFWLLVLLAGAGTFLLRLSFLALVRGEVPSLARRILRLVPMAVLAALIAPAILRGGDAVGDPAAWSRPAAAVVAILVARTSGSMLLTLAAGMAVVWLTAGLT